MKKFIKELRRRQVFRATGLYIGGVWIMLQVAEVILPVYDTPDWVMRTMITVAIIGAPIAIVLAWLFDVSATGIHRETAADATDTVHVSTSRKVDFIVIGVLLVALSGSLFVNFSPREPVILEELDPVTLLVANFENSTGETVFEGALEQALTIGIEESSFITAFDRTTADRILNSISENAVLDGEGARLVSAREGIGIVLVGRLNADGGKYEVAVAAVDTESGEELARFSERANDKSEVLGAVGELARNLREELGDVNVDGSADGEETFTTISLEAMHDYVRAQRLARDGKDEQALGLYQSAVAIDPQFGRAWSGLAVSANKLGRTELVDEAWPRVLKLLEGMTERERYRTAGVYYSLVARNSQKAIENYTKLVEKYPADDAGHNNLAFSYFMALKFDKALEAGKKVVEIYPTRPMYHANYSLYAMYASDFEAAIAEADKTLELNPEYHKAYLPYAAAALAKGNTDAAKAAYEKMAETGARGASLANTGMADMLLWSGAAAAAETVLLDGMKTDAAAANKRALATKKMMRAYAWVQQGKDTAEIVAQIAESLAMSSSTSNRVPAALMYIDLGLNEQAADIAAELGGKLDLQQRAYAKMIEALILRSNEQYLAAIDLLQEAVTLADVWLIRYHLGRAYVSAEHFTEAVSEFTMCKGRLGEAYSLFLDDTPTFRYTAGLDQLLSGATESMTSPF
ncbi:MAG: tetratricopeptide repeat protein [Gammaproteobacteria bacterium]|nr:tetratricopeptide repeat protein [Gammaproteobacteria bacterium]